MFNPIYTLSFTDSPPAWQPALPFQGLGPALALADLLTAYMASRRARGVSANYASTRELMCGRLARLHPDAAVALTPVALEALLLRCAARPVTQNNYLRLIRSAFKWGRRHGLLPAVATGPEVVENRIEQPREALVYAAAEVAALLPQLKPATCAVAALVAFCGVRVAEACRLTWGDLDFARGHVVIRASRAKTRSRRLAPLTEAGAAWLRSVQDNDCPQTLPLWSGTRMQFAGQLRDAHVRAGVKSRRNGLRHSFISYRLAIVGNEHQVALEAGNSPAVIFAAYRELVRTEEAAAWFASRPPAPALQQAA